MDMSILNIKEDNLKNNPALLENMIFVVKLTDKCNLNCSYCYLDNNKTNYELNVDGLLSIIHKFMLQHNIFLNIDLHGGEPLLKMDSIIAIVSFIKEQIYSWRVKFCIQTNGTLLDMEKIEFIRENNLNVGISIDGYKPIHNIKRNSLGTDSGLNKLYENVAILKDKGCNFGFVCVIHDNNISDLPQILEQLSGVTKSLAFNFLLLDNYERSDEKYIQKFKECIDWLLITNSKLDKENRINERTIATYARLLLGKMNFNKTICDICPCKYGTNMITICTGGDIYPCDWLIDKTQKMGDIFTDDVYILMKKFNKAENYKSPDICCQCKWKQLCNGGCISRRIIKHKDNWLDHATDLCYINKAIWSYMELKASQGYDLEALI